MGCTFCSVYAIRKSSKLARKKVSITVATSSTRNASTPLRDDIIIVTRQCQSCDSHMTWHTYRMILMMKMSVNIAHRHCRKGIPHWCHVIT